jgi:hypothetical protein
LIIDPAASATRTEEATKRTKAQDISAKEIRDLKSTKATTGLSHKIYSKHK